MKKIILTLTIAMLTITTVNAESWRNKNNRDNGRNNTTIVINNDRRGNDVTVINNNRRGNDVTIVNNGRRGNDVKVINRDSRPNNDRGWKIDNPRHGRPMIGDRVHEIPRGAVKVHRHGRDYYRVGNVLYDKIATATGIVYSIVELLNS